MNNSLNHVGIIADGNGRWATQRGLERSQGHEAGLHKIDEIQHWCVKNDIKVLSVYCFSWENWNRPQDEIDSLFELANSYFDRYQEFVDNDIKVVISGTTERVSEESLKKMEVIQNATKDCKRLTLNLCVNYSGRMEIIEAIKRGATTEEEIDKMLYNNLPELQLIIRTGGYQRLSNFMLWQSAYSELYFTDTYFPDFSEGEFNHAIRIFEKTQRNHGGI